MNHESDPEAQLVEAVFDALDHGDPETALRLIHDGISGGDEEDPVLHFLAGLAMLELDRPADAVTRLRRAAELDPDDGEFRATLADALFRACRFDEAETESRAALGCDETLALAHHVLGLVHEQADRLDDADRELTRATELEPDTFPQPFRQTRQRFESHLREAIEGLPTPFRDATREVEVSVTGVPAAEILFEESPPLDPELLGLFIGTPRSERTTFSAGGELPARIMLFQRNLERFAESPEDLVEQIGVTLRHELGHYLGLDEDEIGRAGHA